MSARASYERGLFAEAAAAYAEALDCITAGLRDDKHCRAALHSNIAACYRRNKQLEKECGIRQRPSAVEMIGLFDKFCE